ncbi:MAG TPA: hypothetical protein VG797_07510, partial [Phycisphaerales bacterium]|nr:hypothetical protein [Phycisphaerales bacterium]
MPTPPVLISSVIAARRNVRRWSARAAAGVLLLGLLGAGTACDYIAAGMYVLEGPPKINAIAELPQGRSLVVFIDDPQSRLPRRTVRELAGKAAE